MIISVRHGGRLAVWVVSLAVAVWAVNGSSAFAKGGHGGGHHGGGGHRAAHHGGGGHHAAGHHTVVHHAAVHRGGHRVTAHHAVAHHVSVHHAAGHSAVHHVAATHRVSGQGPASRNVAANHRAIVASAVGGQVVNRAGYGSGNNRTGYGFGYGAGYGGNGYYWRRPGYGGYGNYGYAYGNSYPYVYNQYTYNTPYYGESGTVAPSTTADPTTGLLSKLGIDAQSIVDSTGPAVRVTTVYAGTAAQRAGLVGGDLILATNGYITRSRDELAQDVANTPPNGVLSLSVRSVGDVADHSVRVVVP